MAKKEQLPEVKDETEEFVTEVVDEGVIRDAKKETPMDMVDKSVKVKAKGVWKKVSEAQLAQLEADGLLIGYDQETQEVLIKEKK